MRKIKIISTPPGSAPQGIREQWLGIEIPMLSDEDRERFGKTKRLDFSNANGYEVSVDAAIKALKDAGKTEAADYWETVKSMLGVVLVFKKNCCEELDDSVDAGATDGYTPVDINLEQIEYNKKDNCPVGFWEDLFHSEKHNSLEEAKEANDYATVFTVRDTDGIFFWRICRHPQEELTYLRFDIQDPRFGIDEVDKQQMYGKVAEILG